VDSFNYTVLTRDLFVFKGIITANHPSRLKILSLLPLMSLLSASTPVNVRSVSPQPPLPPDHPVASRNRDDTELERLFSYIEEGCNLEEASKDFHLSYSDHERFLFVLNQLDITSYTDPRGGMTGPSSSQITYE
jgi:hypothetical protein